VGYRNGFEHGWIEIQWHRVEEWFAANNTDVTRRNDQPECTIHDLTAICSRRYRLAETESLQAGAGMR
jgi:hypothetical protein